MGRVWATFEGNLIFSRDEKSTAGLGEGIFWSIRRTKSTPKIATSGPVLFRDLLIPVTPYHWGFHEIDHHYGRRSFWQDVTGPSTCITKQDGLSRRCNCEWQENWVSQVSLTTQCTANLLTILHYAMGNKRHALHYPCTASTNPLCTTNPKKLALLQRELSELASITLLPLDCGVVTGETAERNWLNLDEGRRVCCA